MEIQGLPVEAVTNLALLELADLADLRWHVEDHGQIWGEPPVAARLTQSTWAIGSPRPAPW